MKNHHHVIPLELNTQNIQDVALVGVPSMFDSAPANDLIHTGWERATKRMTERNWTFYDGPLLRFEGIEEIEGNVRIYVSRANSYKQVVGLRAHEHEAFSHLQPHERPNALSTINIITTSDERLLMRWRSSGDWDESYELSGGFVRTNEYSLLNSTLQRLTDDLSISQNEIVGQELLTIVHYPRILETMAVFGVRLNLTADEVTARDHRYTKILHLPNTKEAWDDIKSELEKKDPPHMHPPSRTILDTILGSSQE